MARRLLQHKEASASSEITERHVPCENCGPSRKKYWLDHRLRNPARYILKNARYRALIKNLEFNIVEEDIVIPKVCPVLHIPIFLVKEELGKYSNPNAPSLDRIDNSKGYVKDNVRVISWRANQLKKDMTYEEACLIYKDAKNIYNRATYSV